MMHSQSCNFDGRTLPSSSHLLMIGTAAHQLAALIVLAH